MNPLASSLLTDLYELTMLQAHFEQGMTQTAVFELFVRELPPRRSSSAYPSRRARSSPRQRRIR